MLVLVLFLWPKLLVKSLSSLASPSLARTYQSLFPLPPHFLSISLLPEPFPIAGAFNCGGETHQQWEATGHYTAQTSSVVMGGAAFVSIELCRVDTLRF